MKLLAAICIFLAGLVTGLTANKQTEWLVYPPKATGELLLEGGGKAVIVNLVAASPTVTCHTNQEEHGCMQQRAVLQIAVLEHFEYDATVSGDFSPTNVVTTTQAEIIRSGARQVVESWVAKNQDINQETLVAGTKN